MEHINRNCPCCRSQNGKFLYRLSYGEVYKCVDCKTAYTLFNGCDIAKSNKVFEATDFIKTRLYDQYRLRKVALKRLNLLSKFVKSGSILEFGSCTGEFLYEAAKKGYNLFSADLHPVVLDINKTENLKEIIKLDASFFESKRAYFDGIVAFHVIEHLTNPGEFLLNCNTALKPNGVLFLEVPNFESLSRRIWGKRWGMFYDYHVCHFDEDSLEIFTKKYGFEILAIRTIDLPERYIASIYNPLRHRLWSLIKKFRRKESKDITHDNMSNNALVGYSVVDEIKILNSNKARIYRLEAGFIRAISKVLLPICMVLDNYYLGCSLQIVARKIISER